MSTEKPLALLIHEDYLPEVITLLNEVQKKFPITWKTEADTPPCHALYITAQNAFGDAFTYYALGFEMRKEFGERQIGIFADYKKPESKKSWP